MRSQSVRSQSVWSESVWSESVWSESVRSQSVRSESVRSESVWDQNCVIRICRGRVYCKEMCDESIKMCRRCEILVVFVVVMAVVL